MGLVNFLLGFITAVLITILGIPYLYKKRRKNEESELIEDYTRFAGLVENNKDSLYYFQVYPYEKFLYLSPSADNILGEGSVAAVYKNPEICFRDVHPDDYEVLRKKVKGEIDFNKSIIQRWKDKSGRYRWFEEYAIPIYENGLLVAIQGVMRNIDEKVELQKKILYQLHHDTLTDVYNREYFELTFERYNKETNARIAIIVCDLDDLKYTNDNFGHRMGDILIQETARVLNKFASEDITVARIGGDEFVLIVVDQTENQIKQLITDILKEIDHYNINESKVKIKMSVGYSYTPTSKGKMAELFTQADNNMYIDKMNKKKLLVENNH